MSENDQAIEPVADSVHAVAGENAVRQIQPAFLGPTTAQEFNTIRAAIIPVACWRLEDIRFGFDTSFLQPELAVEMNLLARLVREHPGAPAAVFGHADPVGNPEYNKKLSGRRAAAVYAMLTRNPDIWEDIYSQEGRLTAPLGSDEWGLNAVQTMLTVLGYDPGSVDGRMGGQTRDAVRSFQSDQGLGVDGDPGPQTRARLFRAYMDTLCRDENGEPFQMAAADFLGCGADSAGKGDFQGCGEFNPLLMFSREENDRLSRQENRAERNRENAPNRRVLVLLFRPGSRVNLDRWPCPRAKEGVEGCRRRFFSDAQERSRFQDLLREFQNTRDTFACRFYQRISAGSPCESLTSGLMTTNVYISVYFDVSPLPDNLKDRFQLLSHDSMCDLMLGRGDAVPFDEKRLVLRFSGVLPEKRYSLVHHLASGVKNTVFRDIAVVSIDSFGDATPQPRARSAQKPQPEPPPGFDCEDPIVVPDPADEAPREDTETAEESEMS